MAQKLESQKPEVKLGEKVYGSKAQSFKKDKSAAC